MSLASRSTRGAFFLSLSTILNIGIGFLGGILLAHLLAPNDFGTFALANTLNAFMDLRLKLQLEQKFLRDQDTHPDYLNTFLTLNLGLASLSFLLMVGVAIGATAFNRRDLAVCLLILSLLNLLVPFSLTLRLTIERQIAFRQVALVETLTSLVQFALTAVAALLGLGLWSLLLGASANVIVTLILFLRLVPERPRLQLDRKIAKEFLTYGIKYGLIYATSGVILTQFDNLTVGLIAGTFALGFYDRAYRTSLWPTLLISAALGRISLPTYSKLQDDPLRLSKAFSLVLWFLITLTTPLAFILLVTSPDLVLTIYGSQWLPSVTILQILAVFAIFRPLWDDTISILVATQRSNQMVQLVFIQTIFMIVLILPLTWFYGGAGTALSVGLTFTLSALYLLYFAHTHLRVNILEAALLPFFNNLLALIIYFWLHSRLPLENLAPSVRLVIGGLLFLSLYTVVSLITSRRIIMSQVQYLAQAIRG